MIIVLFVTCVHCHTIATIATSSTISILRHPADALLLHLALDAVAAATTVPTAITMPFHITVCAALLILLLIPYLSSYRHRFAVYHTSAITISPRM